MGGIARVWIGYDFREQDAYRVAEASLRKHSSIPVLVTPLEINRLAECGLLRRATDLRGQRYDLPSNAAASTEFAISRFLVPHLAQTGWALFVDSDVLFLGDVAELFAFADPRYAVMCVKHQPFGGDGTKMDGQAQVSYPRKAWSSVMLFNCDHPANKRLSLADVQERPGRDLHGFYWCADSEIGSLPSQWNWLVGCQKEPDGVALAHFTLGTPNMRGYERCEYADLWREAAA